MGSLKIAVLNNKIELRGRALKIEVTREFVRGTMASYKRFRPKQTIGQQRLAPKRHYCDEGEATEILGQVCRSVYKNERIDDSNLRWVQYGMLFRIDSRGDGIDPGVLQSSTPRGKGGMQAVVEPAIAYWMAVK